MDFAGGTPVHICSGSSATAISVYLSRPLFRSRKSSKRTPSHIKLHKPHNISSSEWADERDLCTPVTLTAMASRRLVLLAMVFIWSCWLPFESGTALALNFKAVMAFCVANLSAASGSLTWTLLTCEQGCASSIAAVLLTPHDTDFASGKWSLDAATLGMLAGLVMITPAGGFVSLTDAFLLGIIGACLIYQMLRFKSTHLAHSILWVDPADVFATHCFGGVIATLLTGFFGSREAAGFDGVTDIVGGLLHDGNWYQMAVQALEGLIGGVWSFGASYTIIALIDCVPGMEVLCTDE